MGRTKWLDGLRGLAAFIVALDHLFMSDIWHPYISFWSEPTEANRHLIQLPPIRILFSAQAMVTLFMVISGYAISISLLKARSTSNFTTRASSAIVRRIFRIYLPVLIMASLAQVLYFFQLFSWNFDEDFLARLPKPWSEPWEHVCYVIGFVGELINIVAFRYPGSLNGQLWTMPMEYRGSNIVYLLIVGLSSWGLRSRLWGLAGMAAFFLWMGNWDVFGFIWGLWMAERAVSSSPLSNGALDDDGYEGLDERERAMPLIPLSPLSPGLVLDRGKEWYTDLKARKLSTLKQTAIIILFTTGFYLLCLGLDGHLPPGYAFLSLFHPARWNEDWDIVHMAWKSIGSAMLVYSISELPLLQRLLNARVPQYLGKISFAMYLLHETVYQLWRNPLRNWLYWALSGSVYGTTYEAWSGDALAFHVAWWLMGIVLLGVVGVVSHYYTVYIDNGCVALAKRVDRWLSS